ncbi:phage head closure protein [Erwiniaceae bacterium L1_54_3]|nr:phage head closure protein [Erwiniaceae bacterium L1_54_3]
MQAGKLRHRITIQQPVKSQSPTTGGVIDTWQSIGDVWAEVAASSAREFTAAMAVQSEITTRITIRYRADVTCKHRILYRGKTYNIEGVLPDPVSGLDYLTLPCSEGVNDG